MYWNIAHVVLQRLEEIVWPHVRTLIEEQIHEITQKHRSSYTPERADVSSLVKSAHPSPNEIIIVEAALLLETDWHDLLDGLWVVQSSRSVALHRLKEMRGLTEEEASARIQAQEKRRGVGNPDNDGNHHVCNKLREEMEQGIVTAVITNDGTLMDLQNALEKAFHDPRSFKR